MKKLLAALGCYGLMVASAQADGITCRQLQVMKDDIYKSPEVPQSGISWMLIPILRAQRDHCGLSQSAISRELDASLALESRKPRGGRAAPAPRPPVFCDTTPKANGGSYTDCF
jgi:hypothetical protein